MDIFFQDPNEIPLPPAEVRILEFRAAPYPDGRRVRVYLEVTPFQKRPSADVWVRDAGGATVAEITIIESMTRKMEFTVHLRTPNPQGTHSLEASVYYKREAGEPGEEDDQLENGKIVVDQGRLEFTIPSDLQANHPDELPAGSA